MGEVRHADGPRESRWWRLHPERGLESPVVEDVAALDDSLDGRWRCSQVPAFSAADRAMIDVLTVNHEGRLAVLELKADEDIHLPLQGITIGRGWPGIIRAASFKSLDILRGGS